MLRATLSALVLAAAPLAFAAAQEAETPEAPSHAAPRLPLVPGGYLPYAGPPLAAEQLRGQTVFGPEGEAITTVADFTLTTEGQIEAVLADVGGFLGIGARTISIPFEELDIYRSPEGDFRLYLTRSREEIDLMPEYLGSNPPPVAD